MRKRSRFPVKSLISLVIIAVAAYALWHFFAAPQAGGPAPGAGGFAVPVEAVRVKPERLVVSLSTVGSLRSNESVVLRPEIAGRVESVPFTEGATVKKGELLIALDAGIAQSEVQQVEAQQKLARLSLGRAQKLKQSGAVSQSRLDQANADFAVAAANVSLARAKLEKTRITAPFDGVVGLRKVSPGDYVNVGQELASFESFDPMKVEFTIPEVYAPLVKTGQEIEIGIEALPGKRFTGAVFALDPQVSEGGRSIALRASVPNPDITLKPGYFARINLVADTKENALLIPESAIVPKGSEAYVYVVGADKKVALQKLTLGARQEGRVEVTEGLKEGDIVVTAGQMKLHEGGEAAAQITGDKPPVAAPAGDAK